MMLITFTNKAAAEIQARVSAACPDFHSLWVGTFHNICSKIIRKFGSVLNIQNFTILDTTGTKNLIKDILTRNNYGYSPEICSKYLHRIGDMKNNLISSKQCLTNPKIEHKFSMVYKEYNDICWRNKTFDFDDLIIYALLLLEYPHVQQWFHDNIKYVMVDESQDSNKGNFCLIDMIAGPNNVMLFGDYNQSIYKFRNALPEYLLNYASSHPNTKNMKLEQNYRSTQTIIMAANAIISNNHSDIQMVCSNEMGDKIQLYNAEDNMSEAEWICTEMKILRNFKSFEYKDFAIIARTRLQIRLIETVFRQNGIPYTVQGNQGFYQRKEAMDLLAYCNLYVNENNIDALKRVLKTVKGVGDKTITNILEYMVDTNTKPKNAIRSYLNSGNKITSKAAAGLSAVANIMDINFKKCSELVEEIFLSTDYRRDLQLEMSEESKEKVELIDEFLLNVKECEYDNQSFNINDIISFLVLMSESRKEEKDELNAVKIMTAHSSKGLEFKCVFIVGAEDGLFPHVNSLNAPDKKAAIEEERRLFYVSLTRARKLVYITYCRRRKSESGYVPCSPSRFIKEIPTNLTERKIY